MANSLYNLINNNPTNSVVQALQMVRSAKNPQDMIINMASSNNALAGVLKEIQSNGGNARELFYKKAGQLGVDPENILKMLR